MRLDILSYLEIRGDREWLWSYKAKKEVSLNSQINDLKNCYIDLYDLTKFRLERILSLMGGRTQEFNIVIAEAEPIEFLAAFLAGVIAEAKIFLCDPDWQQQEWQQVSDLVKPNLIFSSEKINNLINLQNKNISKVKQGSSYNQGLIMIPTGGSSGKIKFAMHNWSTLKASVKGFKDYFKCQEINSFCTLPLYHVSGLMQFMRSFLTSGTLIIYPYKILKIKPIIIKSQDYFISLVPTQLQLLINLIPNWLAKFDTVLLGGAPAARSLLEEARKHNIPLAPCYGMTETASQIVTLKPEDFLQGNDSSGKVLPHAQIVVESKNSDPGLINIRSSSLCLGYYPQVFDTPSIFTTDDLGHFDDADYLYIVGRNSHKIITGGENVFPGEVEGVILATKLVKDVCVIGISNRYWGQIVTAIYVPATPNFNLDSIKTQIKLQLAKYKQPKNWIEVNKLPRNNRGKINYQKVKAIAINKVANK